MIAAISTWQERLRGRVYRQFRASNWAYPLANVIGANANELELAFTAFLSLFSIDPIGDDPTSPLYGVGRGVQLDRLGRLVGQSRGAAADSTFRLLLRARILVNRSSGGPEQILSIALAMFAGAGSPLLINGWVAQYTLRFVGVIMDPLDVDSVVAIIGQATQGGTRAVVEWLTVDPSGALICDTATASQTMSDPGNGIYFGVMAGAASAT